MKRCVHSYLVSVSLRQPAGMNPLICRLPLIAALVLCTSCTPHNDSGTYTLPDAKAELPTRTTVKQDKVSPPDTPLRSNRGRSGLSADGVLTVDAVSLDSLNERNSHGFTGASNSSDAGVVSCAMENNRAAIVFTPEAEVLLTGERPQRSLRLKVRSSAAQRLLNVVLNGETILTSRVTEAPAGTTLISDPLFIAPTNRLEFDATFLSHEEEYPGLPYLSADSGRLIFEELHFVAPYNYQAPIVGDWTGDGRDQIGICRGGNVFYFDLNGDGHWDEEVDEVRSFGALGDAPIIGDWDGDRVDDLGVNRGGNYFYLQTAGSGPSQRAVTFGVPGDIPVVGDWDGDGVDDIGVNRGGNRFFLKSAGSEQVNITEDIVFGTSGDTPLIGDWDGDGRDDVGVHRDHRFHLRTGTGTAMMKSVKFGMPRDVPLIGDWNGDGTDDIGVYRADVRFYLDSNGNGAWDEGEDRAAVFTPPIAGQDHTVRR